MLSLIVVQAIGGLVAAFWKSRRRMRRHKPYVDLTDLTALSRSAPVLHGGRSSGGAAHKR